MKKEKTLRASATKTKFSPVTIALLVFLVFYSVSLVTPLLWALMSSFKNQADFRLNVIGLPEKWVWNYSFVFEKFVVRVPTADGMVAIGMGRMFLNSFLYALGCAFAGTLVPCVTSYLCARFPYKFSKVIYYIVIVTMILPIVGNLPSEILVAKFFGLFDHIWGLWIMKANFLGMYFLVFYNVFKAAPKEFTEAAKIDGAGNLSILLRIMLPLARNTFFTVMLINFIGFWNDYQIPLIYLPHYPTVALGMLHMASTTENSLSTVPMRMTGAMLMLLPILVVFLAFQKRLIGNLAIGGIKG